MSSPSLPDPARAAPVASDPSPSTPSQLKISEGPSYLDVNLVGKLLGDLERLDGARPKEVFDRAGIEAAIEIRAAKGAQRAIEAARGREVIPATPKAPESILALDVDHGILCIRGSAHYRDGEVCQDSFAVRKHAPSGSFFGVVADGVSGAKLSQHAAAIFSAALATIAEELVSDESGAYRENGSFMNQRFLAELYRRTARCYLDLCEETGYHPRSAHERFLATTLQLVIVTPSESAILGLSDGVYRFGGGHESVESAIDRFDPGFNTPPLLERVIVDECDRQEKGLGTLSVMIDPIEYRLIREAESFHIIAYGATAAALPEVIEMATDGAEYTDMSPGRGGAFPLIRLAVDEGRDFSEIEGAVLLTHLAVFADEVERCTRLLKSFAALRERHGEEALGEAALLSRWVSQLEPADLGDGVILVRDLIRSGPLGFFRSVGVNRDTTVEGIQAVLDKYQRELEFEHFESYLVDRRVRELGAAVAVLRDLCGRIEGGEPIGRFKGEVDSFLKGGISPGSLEQFELESVGGVSSSTDREVLLRMMVESPEPFTALRREMVGALGVTASNILRDWFGVDPQRLDVPVFDDLTWLVVGPRQGGEPAKDET